MIEIQSVQFGGLSIPYLELKPGLIAVTGPNGSGKTTLLELIAGILAPEQGTVLISGRRPIETTIGWIGEFPDLNMSFTRVRDEIASPLRFTHQSCSATDSSVHDVAGQCGLTSLLDTPIRTLSGGEKVLVALAAALIARPVLLILDETDSHLDYATMRQTDKIIAQASVPLVLFATHRPERIVRADRVIMIQKGRVAGDGTPDEVFLADGVPGGHSPRHRILSSPVLWRAVYAAYP